MAFDGVLINNIVNELNDSIVSGRIDKVHQPEKDEIIIFLRSRGENRKLLLTANATNPRIHFTEKQKENPQSAPLFCMVLRKYLQGGRIVSVTQPNFERIIEIKVESMTEMGDLTRKTLIIEIMGKHSNIVLVDENNIILECIKHISYDKSSVRRVMPGQGYVYPPNQDKNNPLTVTENEFLAALREKDKEKLHFAIYSSFSGISPVTSSEIILRGNLDASNYVAQFTESEINIIYKTFAEFFHDVKEGNFKPNIVYSKENGSLLDLVPFDYKMFLNEDKVFYDDISKLIEEYYDEKDNRYRINQRAYDLKNVVNTNLERCYKKKEIHKKTLDDTKNMDKWKRNGELITANIYAIKEGMDKFSTVDFYDENLPEIEISIDKDLSPVENAQRYFKKYNKAKRTIEALKSQEEQNEEEINYLESVLLNIEKATAYADINDIREELYETGFIKKATTKKGKKTVSSKPLQFKTSDGFTFFVGKNNKQNDELTFGMANGNDIWFHTKNIAGSHGILLLEGRQETDTAIKEVAEVCAFYSKGKLGSQVPVDYTIRKNVKKPSGAKPGFVIYVSNKTIYVTPSEERVKQLLVE